MGKAIVQGLALFVFVFILFLVSKVILIRKQINILKSLGQPPDLYLLPCLFQNGEKVGLHGFSLTLHNHKIIIQGNRALVLKSSTATASVISNHKPGSMPLSLS